MSNQRRHQFSPVGPLETLDSRVMPAMTTFFLGPRFPMQHPIVIPTPLFNPALLSLMRIRAIQLNPTVAARLALSTSAALSAASRTRLLNLAGLGSAVRFHGKLLVSSAAFSSSLRPFMTGFGPAPFTSAQIPFLMLGTTGQTTTTTPGTIGSFGTTSPLFSTGFGLALSPLVAGSALASNTTTGMMLPGVMSPF